MSIIKCPECNRKVSDKAITCHRCDFPIKDYAPTQEQIDEKNKQIEEKKRKTIKRVKKYLIITIAIITSICIIGCVIGIGMYYQAEKEFERKYSLFNHSYVLSADPYGLSNENNVIGKQISTVLAEGEYIENEDFTISTEDDYISYTFPLNDYPLGSNPKLVLYTSNGVIFKIEYTFRLAQRISSWSNMKIFRTGLTDYHDVDPIYAGYDFDNDEYINMTKDEYSSLPYSNYYDVTFITWESDKGTAILSFTNMFEEKLEYGAITFTNDEIKKEEYQNHIDKYSHSM